MIIPSKARSHASFATNVYLETGHRLRAPEMLDAGSKAALFHPSDVSSTAVIPHPSQEGAYAMSPLRLINEAHLIPGIRSTSRSSLDAGPLVGFCRFELNPPPLATKLDNL